MYDRDFSFQLDIRETYELAMESVTVNGQEYGVSGIYQCANDMGSNIGIGWKDIPKSVILPGLSGVTTMFWRMVRYGIMPWIICRNITVGLT